MGPAGNRASSIASNTSAEVRSAHQVASLSLINSPLSPRVISSLKRGSSTQWSSPMRLAQRLNRGPPTDCTNTQPVLVLKVSAGPEV